MATNSQSKPSVAEESPLVVTPGFRAAALPKKIDRQVFVAYSYRLYPKADYRKVFTSLTAAFDVRFVFADEKITNLHILEKIKNYIVASQFGIYDISGWNPNVTLELGLALGLGEAAYVAIDPSRTTVEEVPADLRGIDRIQYVSYSELEDKLGQLIAQEMPVPRTHEAENQLVDLRKRVFTIVSTENGLRIADIARALGVSTALAQVVIKPLVGAGLCTEGQRRGTKYYLDPKNFETSR